jgi:adenylate cyclase
VMDHDGVVIDYYGDGLAAMWNAPADQPDHPELACRAALRMVEALPAVRERWAGVLRDDLRLGVGVHTGIAQVGNAGSNRRWKYGPRGANVNLTSRVEAATKLIGVPIVVTRAVASRLSNRLHTYRICRGRLPGIKEPVDLYGIFPANVEPSFASEISDYRHALELFEAGQLAESARCLKGLTTPFARVPARFLAEHVEPLLLQQQGRRKSDTAAAQSDGVITLNVK